MVKPESFDCWSITAMTWWPSTLASRVGLRWHLHELVPELEIPPQAPRRQHVPADLEGRLELLEGAMARILRGTGRVLPRADDPGQRVE
jgi:hypothetical protein